MPEPITDAADPFADIRPYNDDEVRPTLDKLLADPEMIDTIGHLRFPRIYAYASWLLQPVIRAVLKRELRGIDTVWQFQSVIKKYMDRMIEGTTSGFTVSGLDSLEPGRAYLFISNHRDITLDPAFVNYALYHNGHDTVRIAIGDNLLSKPFAADLMRLNKSFIVKRSITAPRQMLAASRHLSAYIRHSLEQEGCPVWIAQRAGRAKDGNDATEVALIKMLSMSRDKSREDVTEHLRSLRVVPVAISYEYDPCDGAKAKELHAKASQGRYEKEEHEDLLSIGRGIAGHKGAVHVSFGEPLQDDYIQPEELARAIDRQVLSRYVLHPTNFFAYEKLHGEYPPLPCGSEGRPFAPERNGAKQRAFEQRIAALPAPHRDYALRIYANPVANKLALSSGAGSQPD